MSMLERARRESTRVICIVLPIILIGSALLTRFVYHVAWSRVLLEAALYLLLFAGLGWVLSKLMYENSERPLSMFALRGSAPRELTVNDVLGGVRLRTDTVRIIKLRNGVLVAVGTEFPSISNGFMGLAYYIVLHRGTTRSSFTILPYHPVRLWDPFPFIAKLESPTRLRLAKYIRRFLSTLTTE